MIPRPDADGHVATPASPDVVVLAGGDALPAELLTDVARAIDGARFTVAADGGLAHADRCGRAVDTVVGDLDSVDHEALTRAREDGTEVVAHPEEKDATDLDLALALVLERWGGKGRPRVLVVGGHGGRLDHLLGNLLVLSADRYADLSIEGWLGSDVVHVVRDRVELHGGSGATVSLLALPASARGVTTTGLRYPLSDATLPAGSSLGLSNRIVADHASVTVEHGVLVVIQSN